MQFIWDSYNINHIAPHGVAPEEAEQVLQNDPFDLQTEFRNGEYRTTHIGETDAARILIVLVTLRDDRIRVVTAYPAKPILRRFYAHQKESRNAKIH